jgi:hypothetical protein
MTRLTPLNAACKKTIDDLRFGQTTDSTHDGAFSRQLIALLLGNLLIFGCFLGISISGQSINTVNFLAVLDLVLLAILLEEILKEKLIDMIDLLTDVALQNAIYRSQCVEGLCCTLYSLLFLSVFDFVNLNRRLYRHDQVLVVVRIFISLFLTGV